MIEQLIAIVGLLFGMAIGFGLGYAASEGKDRRR